MRLRKECEHERWEEHPIEKSGFFKLGDCPGGEFLPEGALVIEKVDGEWPKLAKEVVIAWYQQWTNGKSSGEFDELFDALAELPSIADALASQVGESE